MLPSDNPTIVHIHFVIGRLVRPLFFTNNASSVSHSTFNSLSDANLRRCPRKSLLGAIHQKSGAHGRIAVYCSEVRLRPHIERNDYVAAVNAALGWISDTLGLQ